MLRGTRVPKMAETPAYERTRVLIDSSYFNFYRFFATVRWYNYSDERREKAEGVPWLENPTFMTTFEKMWFETVKKLCKKFAVDTDDLLFARDGNDVWRYKLYPAYKGNRPSAPEDEEVQDDRAPGPVFKYVNEHFHKKLGVPVVRIPEAEADDIIAVAVNYIKITEPETKIIIISGDHDLLQLSEPGLVEVYNLNKFTELTVDNPRETMMLKILGGDPSDNIPSAFKGCGKKTAQKLACDPKELKKVLKEKGRKQYELNDTLINFENIPESVTIAIEEELDDIL